MKKLKFITNISKPTKKLYLFLKTNGFFEELIRGMAKILLLFLVFLLFGQYVW